MKTRERGVTLIELMVVVAIVAVLVSIAVPSYRNYVLRANRAEARAALLALAVAEEKFYLQCNTYTTALDGTSATACSPANLQFNTTSERGYYTIAVSSADANTWTATATAASGEPQYDDSKCRTFQFTAQGVKTAKNAANAANDNECWSK